MAEPVEWEPDGTPHSPRFGDIYRSSSGALAQARHVFLRGCGLPAAWAGQAQWRILETGFGLGTNFLATWQAWKADPARPHILHFVSVEAWPVSAEDIVRAARQQPELLHLADELAGQWFGLTPGAHRLNFEGGRVLLTVHVREAREMLRREPFTADSVFLDGFDPRVNPEMWEAPVLQAVARHCRRGTRLATWTVAGEVRRALGESGFQLALVEGLPPKRHCLAGSYDPHWEPRQLREQRAAVEPGECIVVGAGLAGAAAAASLARRGWRVTVVDAAPAPAAGASGLPVGLLAPHHSPDDNILSRLTRAGVRLTLREAAARLDEGHDYAAPGVLEHGVEGPARGEFDEAHAPWSRPADEAQIRAALLPAGSSALWHAKAAWIRPSALVQAWLSEDDVRFRGDVRVGQIAKAGDEWLLSAPGGAPIGRARLVVIAAALGSREVWDALNLNAVRGQVCWGAEPPGATLPPFPVNGHGHFISGVPMEGETHWYCGSTFGRGDSDVAVRDEDHAKNLERLRTLLPEAAAQFAEAFDRGEVQAWAGVRCTSTDRRPLVGELAPGLCVSTGMGSRGLTFSVLAAELLAARLHGEPLPVDARLAAALDAARGRSSHRSFAESA